MKRYLWIILILSACSGMIPKKVVLDSSSDKKPEWVDSSKTTYEKDARIYFRSTYTARGSDRIDGCYDHAKLNGRATVLSEIATDLKGSLNQASESISEDAEDYLTKVQSGNYEGRVVGLRYSEEYFERYAIKDEERIACYVLGEMREVDYNAVKRTVIQKLTTIDSRLKDAVMDKNVDFFKKQLDRATASEPKR